MPVNEDEWRRVSQGAYNGQTAFGVPMSNFTSLGIGGRADLMVVPEDPLSLRNVMVLLGKQGIPFFTLGGGTNVLIRDGGIQGAVISLRGFNRIETIRDGTSDAELFVEAGAPWQKVVNFCRERGYAGVEGLTGIPGTFGGAVCGNAGSFGYEVKDVVRSVAIMDSRGKLDRFKAEGLGFGYRKSGIPPTEIVLSANVVLKKDDTEAVSKRTEGFFAQKKGSQPIAMKSAGCVFKNPEGAAAGKLIDEAGCKGMRQGGIEVSAVHANFFVNTGAGTAADFVALMDRVSSEVQQKFGVALEPEIKIVGRN